MNLFLKNVKSLNKGSIGPNSFHKFIFNTVLKKFKKWNRYQDCALGLMWMVWNFGAVFLPQALFPVSFMFSRSLKFPAKESTSKQDLYFPYLIASKPQTISDDGSRRVYLELSLGYVTQLFCYSRLEEARLPL